MGRWQPGARGRLQLAALELYADPGFEQTTVADIAARAGVTERTFFRHFADKREVLFAGSSELQASVVAAIATAPASDLPIDVVAAAMIAGAGLIDGRRDYAQQRAAAIAANSSLQERELLKLATLGAAAAAALRLRGVTDPTAGLVGETGATLFKVGFEWWLAETSADTFAGCIAEALARLKSLTATG